MNRRGFLANAIAAVAALAIDPERLLWTPGVKTIFIPPNWPERMSYEEDEQALYSRFLFYGEVSVSPEEWTGLLPARVRFQVIDPPSGFKPGV